jgi:hypothetical protein
MPTLIDRDFDNKINRLMEYLIDLFPYKDYYTKERILKTLNKHIKGLELYE